MTSTHTTITNNEEAEESLLNYMFDQIIENALAKTSNQKPKMYPLVGKVMFENKKAERFRLL